MSCGTKQEVLGAGCPLCHQLELLCFDYSYHLIAVILGALVFLSQLCI